MIKKLLLYICVICIAPLYAQENLPSKSMTKTPLAYILKNSGDTVRGKITLKFGNENLKWVTIESTNGSKEKYSPGEIRAVFANGALFESKILSIERATGETSPINETVFVEVLARAKESLLYYKDERDINHFFIEDQNHLEELVVKKISGDNFNTQRLDLYKGQLKSRFKNCPSQFSEIDKLPYQRSKMLNLFVKECECSNQKLIMTSARKTKFKMRWGLAGVFTIAAVGGFIWATKDHYDPFSSN